jgi:hypothetical protein
MKAALAPDQPLAGSFATEVVISDGDFSTASDPELVKNTWSKSPGASAAIRLAKANAFGCPN